MRASRCFSLILASLLSTAPLLAQQNQRQTLTQAQVEQIREAGIDPDLRIHLYTKFVGEHIDAIESLTKRGHSAARARRLDNELQDLSALMDELGSNLDQYGDRKADLRKSLKQLTEATPHWLAILTALPPEPGFNLSLEDATDSEKDLADEAKQMYTDQVAYFNLHKDQRGQERAEPQ
jgi:hypothetical protein